jgi:hypothetical protein
VPTRVRVRIARKRNDDEDAKEELYSYVTVAEVPAEGFANLGLTLWGLCVTSEYNRCKPAKHSQVFS